MKKLIIACCVLLGTLPLHTQAQQTITEGKVFYDITYSDLSEEMKMRESQLPHDAAFYFKGPDSRIEMGAGPFGKNVTITNKEKKQTIVLLNIYDRKFAIIKTDSEMLEVRSSFITDTAKTIVQVTMLDDTKNIAGYTCHHALITRTTGKRVNKTDCWFTRELPPYNSQYDDAYKQIDGFLMQYSMNEGGINMTMTVKMVMPVPIDDKMFSVPETYRVVTEKELIKILNVLEQERSGY